MKKLIILSTLLATAHFAQAQMGKPHFRPHHPPSVEERVEHMTERLSLTDDQVVQITEIMNSQEAEREELMTSLKALHELEREQINAVLTDEQKEQLASRPRKDSEDQ